MDGVDLVDDVDGVICLGGYCEMCPVDRQIECEVDAWRRLNEQVGAEKDEAEMRAGREAGRMPGVS